jgi:hypothetical protein
VLARALTEVVNNWDPAWGDLYSMTAEQFASFVLANWDSMTMVDSPLQNLALMEASATGSPNLSQLGIDPASRVDVVSIFIGVASDKNLAISNDTITALNLIMDLGLSAAEIAAIAAKAESVREAVAEAHG